MLAEKNFVDPSPRQNLHLSSTGLSAAGAAGRRLAKMTGRNLEDQETWRYLPSSAGQGNLIQLSCALEKV